MEEGAKQPPVGPARANVIRDQDSVIASAPGPKGWPIVINDRGSRSRSAAPQAFEPDSGAWKVRPRSQGK